MPTQTNRSVNRLLQVRVYGTLQKTKTFTRRYWHKRKDGIRQRYLHKITQTKTKKAEKQFNEKDGKLNEQIAEWVEDQQKGDYDWIEKDDDSPKK